MNYQETLNWLYNQLPMYHLQGASAYKKDLTNVHLLAEHLGHPEQKLRCIHIAGTNGKGSTSHLLASVLKESGYKIGLYTSPHLKDFRERIKIISNETLEHPWKEIPEEYICNFVNQHRSFFEANDMSFFEMTVGLAFDYFVEQKVDLAIIEVGMGGRLDATNIITPLVSVITNIGLDHTQFLGNTHATIASEKAGIIKNNVPVIIGEYTNETLPVFINKAKSTFSDIYLASDLISSTYPSDLLGDYQVHNKKTVMQTIAVLNENKITTITPKQIQLGMANTIANTGLQGRWQQLNEIPKVIADTAHNKNGLAIVMHQIQKEKFEQLHIVLGFVNDKDLKEVLPLFPKNAIYYFCKPNIPRGLDTDTLQTEAQSYQLIGKVFPSVSAAYQSALETATASDFVYVGGSTFVVAEIL